ncbi:hypothetical protein E2C01_078543 [Portunus trituberculatus]|uniref:Uncharacterized protein n=1 Tax=Portunus trituberculatus TaxID=210409 RepID=A0A5B7IUE4_PORTR|nr:hypothetical protein [Portunus trituberculatus]
MSPNFQHSEQQVHQTKQDLLLVQLVSSVSISTVTVTLYSFNHQQRSRSDKPARSDNLRSHHRVHPPTFGALHTHVYFQRRPECY